MLRVARISLMASATRNACAATSGTPISSPNVARARGPAIKSVGTGHALMIERTAHAVAGDTESQRIGHYPASAREIVEVR